MIARSYGSRSLVAIVGGCSLAGAFNAVAGGVPWTLPPGTKAVMETTDVSCAVTATTVICEKAGGLAATLSAATNTVRVLKKPTPLGSARTTVRLGYDSGFVITGDDARNIYCHVYLSGTLTMSCAVNGGSSAGARGFDISDSAVVLFRYARAGIRHDLKALQQP